LAGCVPCRHGSPEAVDGPRRGQRRPNPDIAVPRSVAEVLTDRVTLEVACIDRMHLKLYAPKLQYDTGVVPFFKGHRGATFASSAQ